MAAVVPQRRQADAFRADLLAAARKGEAFNMATGELVSWPRDEPGTSWYRVRVRLRRYEVEDGVGQIPSCHRPGTDRRDAIMIANTSGEA